MTKSSDDNYTAVLLEEIGSQMQAVLEISQDTQRQITVLPTMQDDIASLKDDVRIIKVAVTDTNKELKLLERRVTKLEEKIV